MLSPEYLAAIAAHNRAVKAYNKAAMAFRGGEISADEFGEVCKIYDVATAAYDAAFKVEQKRE